MGMFSWLCRKTDDGNEEKTNAKTSVASNGDWQVVGQYSNDDQKLSAYCKDGAYEFADLLKLFLLAGNSPAETQMWTVAAQKSPDNYIVWKTYGVAKEADAICGSFYSRHGEVPVLINGKGVPFLAEYVEEKPFVFHVDLCGNTAIGADYVMFGMDISWENVNQIILHQAGDFDLARYLSGREVQCAMLEQQGDTIICKIKTPKLREAYITYPAGDKSRQSFIVKLFFTRNALKLL